MRPAPARSGSDVETTARIAGPSWKSLKSYLLYRRHLFAYECAMHAVRPGATWLDVGSGSGYALERISRHASRTLAVDRAWAALRADGAGSGVQRVRGDACELPLATGSVRVVLCFQVLEHLEQALARRLLTEVRRVLAPGGCAFLTTPNARWRLQPPTNPHHVVEYGPEAIEGLCEGVGIPRSRIQGVVGLHGAQEVELARLARNPLRARGVLSGHAWRELLSARRPPERRRWRRYGARDVRPEDVPREWFALTGDTADALDFWIRISK